MRCGGACHSLLPRPDRVMAARASSEEPGYALAALRARVAAEAERRRDEVLPLDDVRVTPRTSRVLELAERAGHVPDVDEPQPASERRSRHRKEQLRVHRRTVLHLVAGLERVEVPRQ